MAGGEREDVRAAVVGEGNFHLSVPLDPVRNAEALRERPQLGLEFTPADDGQLPARELGG